MLIPPPPDSDDALAGPLRALREQAEAIAAKSAAQSSGDIASLAPEATRLLLHDLRVQQIELEMQNQELRRSQVELEALQDRYFNLYEFAPVGYCSTSASGLIVKANLAATSVLGVARGALLGQPISRFIFREDQDVFYRVRKQLFETAEPRAFELRMVKHDGTLFWAHLACSAAQGAGGASELRVALSDVTERKAVEARLVIANAELVLQNEEKGKRAAELVIANEELTRRSEALRKSDQSLREAQMIGGVGSFDIDVASDRWTGTEELEAIYGIDPSHAHDFKAWTRLIHPDERGAMIAYCLDVIDRKSDLDREFRIVRANDGAVRWIHGRCKVLYDETGKAQRAVGTAQDITGRKRAEEMLRNSEARHISMVSNISDVIAIIGADGIVKYRSSNIEKWFGWQPRDTPGANGWLTVHPDDLKRIREKFRALLETDNSVAVMEYRFKCKDGSYKPIELHATNLVNDPAICGVLLNYHDITARKQAEAGERKLARALEQSPAAVMITDPTGSIEYVNPQFEKITGYAAAEVLGRNPRILKSGLTPAQTYREIWRAASAGGLWRGELQNRRKSGELYWESAAISGLKDEHGQVTHLIGVKADITASKQAVEALREVRAREIGIGASIQRSLLGEVPQGIEGAQLAAYADPSQIIDGDFYAVRRYRPDCFEVLVGDVMGKGVQAALLGAGVITAYNRALADLLVAETNARSLPTPAAIINAVHLALTPQMIALSTFATLALYRFDLGAGTLTYVSAGHTPGLLTRGSDARPVAIMGDNLPIGVLPEEVYVQSSLAVGPGDSLLLFSDGITEARNAAGEEFGLERLCGLIEPGSMADLPPATMLHALRGEQRRFTGGGPGADDLTALMVKLRPRRRAPRGRIEDRVEPLVFTLLWSLEGLGALRPRIAECAGSLPAEDADALILASFEAATNAIRHARLMVGDATLVCRIAREGDAVAVELIYPSAAFTPPAEVRPDLSGESEGGFGLYIIEQSVDSVEYASPMSGIASVRLVKRASARAQQHADAHY